LEKALFQFTTILFMLPATNIRSRGKNIVHPNRVWDTTIAKLAYLTGRWNIFTFLECAVILCSLVIIVLIIYYFLKETGVLYSSVVSPKKESIVISKLKYLMQKLHGLTECRVFLHIILIVILSRLTIFLLGYIATALFQNPQIGIFSSFEEIWNRWDSPHYIDIARNGYTNEGDSRFFIIYYPLYPLLIRVFSYITSDLFSAGLLVSNISLVLACYYLYKLVLLDFDNETADKSVLFLLIYPFSFFAGIVYTESLFLMLTIKCFYYMRERKWLMVGLTGFLTTLTKNQGVLIFLPAVIEYIVSSALIDKIKQRKFKMIWIGFLTGGIYLFIIPLGTLVYFAINRIFAGNWFMFLEYERTHWHTQFGFFPSVVKSIFANSTGASGEGLIRRISFWIPQSVSFSTVLLLILCSFNKLRVSYIAYMFVFLIISFSPTWSICGARYTYSIFPIFIAFGLFSKNRTLFLSLIFFFTIMLAFYTVAFVRGFPVM